MTYSKLDADGYPTKEGLNDLMKLLNYADAILKDNFKRKEIIAEIKANWQYPEYVREAEDILYISTMGWSGNEETIGVILCTMFSNLYWKSSKRGGHYEFNLPKEEKL